MRANYYMIFQNEFLFMKFDIHCLRGTGYKKGEISQSSRYAIVYKVYFIELNLEYFANISFIIANTCYLFHWV